MLKNRDSQRTNRANRAVKACLFGKITKDTLKAIQQKTQTYPNTVNPKSVTSYKLLTIQPRK